MAIPPRKSTQEVDGLFYLMPLSLSHNALPTLLSSALSAASWRDRCSPEPPGGTTFPMARSAETQQLLDRGGTSGSLERVDQIAGRGAGRQIREIYRMPYYQPYA